MGLCAAWTFTVVTWIPVLLLAIVTWRHLPDGVITAVIRFWGRAALRLCGIRLVLDNPSTLDGRKPRVVIINHQSGLDLAWCAAVLPPGSLALGKRELVYLPVINVAWWTLRYLRIDRQHPHKGSRMLRSIAPLIRNERRSLLISPEGTRTCDGQLQGFKPGAFRFAAVSGAPIYPVVVQGAFTALPRHRVVPAAGTVHLRFLDPIPTHTWDPSDLDDHIENTRRAMLEALDAMHESHPPC